VRERDITDTWRHHDDPNDYQRPDYIDQDALLTALQDLGINPPDIKRITITPHDVLITEYLTDSDGTKSIDWRWGEPPLCEYSIPVHTPESWEIHHRQQWDLAHPPTPPGL
jgi:hypothetical protein